MQATATALDIHSTTEEPSADDRRDMMQWQAWCATQAAAEMAEGDRDEWDQDYVEAMKANAEF